MTFVMRNIPRFQKEWGAIIRGGAIFRGNTVFLDRMYCFALEVKNELVNTRQVGY